MDKRQCRDHASKAYIVHDLGFDCSVGAWAAEQEST